MFRKSHIGAGLFVATFAVHVVGVVVVVVVVAAVGVGQPLVL